MKITNRLVLIFLIIAFLIRFYLAFAAFNPDSYIYFAWMKNVTKFGWSGLYERQISRWPAVNYPPLTLYSFWLTEKVFTALPARWDNSRVHAALYKVPSLIADCLVAWLIWRLTPFRRQWRLMIMAVYLFNPGLFYNSIWWGQIEGWAALWCILVVFLVARKQTILAIPVLAIALLCKQNSAPLTLLVLVYLWIDRPPLKKIIAAGIFSLGLIYMCYAPFMTRTSSLLYPFRTYIQSLSGQPHQHLASVNALNFWYAVGLNNQSDNQVRIVGWIMALLLIGLIGWQVKKFKLSRYQQVWILAVTIFIATFTFVTRMHERHIYMSIAMLTMLLPYLQKKWWWLYGLLSIIGWYSLHIVWAEMMTQPPVAKNIWEIWTRSLAGVVVVASVALPILLTKIARIK